MCKFSGLVFLAMSFLTQEALAQTHFPHIITGNDSKRIYRINEYGQTWDNWTTSSVVGAAAYPSGMSVDPNNGTLWWSSEHSPRRIVNQKNDGTLIVDRLMTSVDTTRADSQFETEAVISLPDGTLVVLDDWSTGTIYHLGSDFSIIERIENVAARGMTSIQGGCYDFQDNTILVVDNTSNNHAVYRLDMNFHVVEIVSLESGITPELSSPQDLAIKDDGTWLLAGYGGGSAPEKDIIYHIEQDGFLVNQLGTISVQALPSQKNPTGISIYRGM